MQSDAALVMMMEAVEAAAPKPVDPTTLSILSNPFPFARRMKNLAINDREAMIEGLSVALAMILDIGDEFAWLARKGLDVAIPEGREADLDDPDKHWPAILRALVALGLRPCRMPGRRQEAPMVNWPMPPHAA